FTTAGLATVSVSLFLLSTLGSATPFSTVLVYLVIGGGGMGLFVSPNMSSIMGSVPAHRRGVASGLRATFFNVGYTLSFNIVILILALSVPYAVITSIISSASGVHVTLADKDLFVAGLNNVYRVLVVINTVAIIPSLLRGRRVVSKDKEPDSDSNTGAATSLSAD
ncbi:MAG: hypothetical protein ACHQYR_03410, partial [Candidatus Gagatemarchaeaceae archaeon]